MLGSVITDGLTHCFAKAPGRGCTHRLSPCSQRPKPRTLHHHREEPRLLAAVWRWHRGGASLSPSLAVGVCVGPPCAPSTQPVCLCVGLGVCVWCRKSTPRPSRSFTALPQTSPRTPSRDTSSSTSPGTDQSPWQEKTERDSSCCFVLFCFFE